jgi:hypothetical protein
LPGCWWWISGRERERAAGGVLEEVAGEEIHGVVYRSGILFNAGEWTFPDYPLRGVYARNEVYESVRGWESFEPWLSRIEKMEEDVVWRLAGEIPPEWYGGEWDELEKLVRTLIARRGVVRELIEAFRVSPRRPFPEWVEQVRRFVFERDSAFAGEGVPGGGSGC